MENLIPTPKDTAERQKMGIFGWSSEKAPLAAKLSVQKILWIQLGGGLFNLQLKGLILADRALRAHCQWASRILDG